MLFCHFLLFFWYCSMISIERKNSIYFCFRRFHIVELYQSAVSLFECWIISEKEEKKNQKQENENQMERKKWDAHRKQHQQQQQKKQQHVQMHHGRRSEYEWESHNQWRFCLFFSFLFHNSFSPHFIFNFQWIPLKSIIKNLTVLNGFGVSKVCMQYASTLCSK